jgi:hypothetical protein
LNGSANRRAFQIGHVVAHPDAAAGQRRNEALGLGGRGELIAVDPGGVGVLDEAALQLDRAAAFDLDVELSVSLDRRLPVADRVDGGLGVAAADRRIGDERPVEILAGGPGEKPALAEDVMEDPWVDLAVVEAHDLAARRERLDHPLLVRLILKRRLAVVDAVGDAARQDREKVNPLDVDAARRKTSDKRRELGRRRGFDAMGLG